MAMRLDDAMARATRLLDQSGVSDARREARLLAAHLLGAGSVALLDPATLVDAAAYEALVARRAAREPLALITGRRGFWTLELEVSGDTLVPRADSETLVEAALAQAGDPGRVRRVLDLGTGTGCLLLAVLESCPAAFGVGVDVSVAACGLAARNAARAGLAGRCAFLAGDWAASVQGRFDLVLSNPPYIESGALAGLMPEVRLFEPARALDGGVAGLDAYAAILPGLAALLAAGGAAVLELGAGQDDAVRALAGQARLRHVETRRDLGGILRAAVFVA